MSFTNYIIASLVFFGALIMLMSATYTKKIFTLLPNNELRRNWKKLRFLMLVFLVGYIIVVLVVVFGQTKLLALFSGLIFFLGSLFVFIVVKTGVDSLKKINELHQNLDDTELKNKELEQFAYITSHDLKTPLRGISSLASFIKEDLKTGKNNDVFNHIDILQDQVERLENLINGILHYSKIGKISLTSINLNTLIDEEIKNYQNFNHVKFTVKKLPTVNGDIVQLRQVMANLISNAIKHNDKELCEIIISSIKKEDFYEIIFEDNGPGIDPKYHQKIFEVFQTINEKNTPENTGIGLSIVKKVIEKHSGTIKVISDGVLGTKFVIRYPTTL